MRKVSGWTITVVATVLLVVLVWLSSESGWPFSNPLEGVAIRHLGIQKPGEHSGFEHPALLSPREAQSLSEPEFISNWTKIAEIAAKNKNGNWFTVDGCNDDDLWMAHWLRIQWRNRRGEFRFVDVGANKGYTIAAWMASASRKSPPNVRRDLAKHLALYQVQAPKMIWFCGGCCECMSKQLPESLRESLPDDAPWRVEIVGFEGNPGSAERLVDFFTSDKTAAIRPQDVTVKIVQKPVSSSPGPVNFYTGPAGAETASINVRGTNAGENMTSTSLDDHFSFLLGNTSNVTGSTVIDFLSTDTEGHDPLVMKGAQQLLRNNKIAAYQFESWANEANTTQQLNDLVDQYNFQCYLPMQYIVAQVNTGDLDDQRPYIPSMLDYEIYREILREHNITLLPLHGWANVICFHKELNAELLVWLRGIAARPLAVEFKPFRTAKLLGNIKACPLSTYSTCLKKNYIKAPRFKMSKIDQIGAFKGILAQRFFNQSDMQHADIHRLNRYGDKTRLDDFVFLREEEKCRQFALDRTKENSKVIY